MPPPLPDELIEEIFLRLPPGEPACLRRASLASKFWRGLLTGTAFRGRYRERHGDPHKAVRCSSGRGKKARVYRQRAANKQNKFGDGLNFKKMIEDLRAAMAVNYGQVSTRARQAPPSSKHHLQKTTKHVGIKQAPARPTLANGAAQFGDGLNFKKMLEDLQAAMAVNSGHVSTRARQATPSSKHHLQTSKHVRVKQAPSRPTLMNVAAQPVSHTRGNAALRDVVNTNANKVDEKTRKLHESAKKQVDVKAKVARFDVQSERKLM